MTPAEAQERAQQAAGALNQGRPGEARALLAPVVEAFPKAWEVRRLNGAAFRMEGDLRAAELEFRAAVAADKRQALAHVALGQVLVLRNEAVAAERAFRAALALNPRQPDALVGLVDLLLVLGRPEDALKVSEPVARSLQDFAALNAHANALKFAGRIEDAIPFQELAVAYAPTSAVAEHNLAATLGDVHRFEEAEAATARALAKGGDAPETWLVRARALQQLRRFEEAQAAYREAIRRRPAYVEAHRELGQLIWMLTEDATAATADMDAVLARRFEPQLFERKVKLLEYAGDLEGAHRVAEAALTGAPTNPALQVVAARAALGVGKADAALAHAERAVAQAPDRAARLALCEAALAVGDASRAADLVDALRREAPDDQYLMALQATAWRLSGDARYEAFFDYAAFVRPQMLDTPQGWASLDAFLADLKPALEQLHAYRTHPLDQSLRHGTQASPLPMADPVIGAFFQAIDGPIRRYIAELGKGRDPFRRRNQGGYRIKGSWSVRLRASGFHTDHVHPEGWISSACYIDLPRAVGEGDDRAGWIKFGEPGALTRPPLAPEHFVRPEAGLLVLFPSYMWHGTVPFSGDDHRLTVAFDLLPEKAGGRTGVVGAR